MTNIRPYVAADRHACLKVFHSNLPHYFDKSEVPEFEAFLDTLAGDYFVLERDGSVVACGGCYIRDGVGRLSWGMVASQVHRTSIGSLLLAWRINQLFLRPDVAEIEIDTSQHSAGFFSYHGFGVVQRVSDGFGEGIDQVSMSLQRTQWRGCANRPFHADVTAGAAPPVNLLR